MRCIEALRTSRHLFRHCPFAPVKEHQNISDPNKASNRYRWAIITRGYLLTNTLATDTPPTEDCFFDVFMEAAQAQAIRDGIPFDPFNSSTLITHE
jgi:hypothetical protein